ncbi:MAG: orotate phosphoribosyltransferase [Candidatus Diapherotrites archaeon]|nr:orotate phosphoribosyltransferase [Candidatus Diapherotrites archaeon]
MNGICGICHKVAELNACQACGTQVCSNCFNPETRFCIQCMSRIKKQ